MAMDYVFQGPPTLPMVSPGTLAAPAVGLDSVNGVGYLNSGKGWVPQVPATIAKGDATAQTANIANLLTYAVPPHMSGTYRITSYISSTNTPTAATLPGTLAQFTEQDTGATVNTNQSGQAGVSSQGVVSAAILAVNAKGGNNIVLSTVSYAAGSGTALQYNIHVRIDYLG